MGRLANALLRAGGWLGPYGSNDPVLQALFGSQPTAAGVALNETTALNLSAVWAAVTALAGPVGMLPLVLYKRTDRGKEPFFDHPLYRLLHDQPNPEQTAPVFRETLQAHVLTWGNGYAEIQRTPDGRPLALWTITPDRVQPYRDAASRQIRYRVTNDSGTQVDVDADRILHIPGLGFDGICGYSVIRKARESLGLTGAIERFGASFFGNGAWPGIVAQHPGKLSEEAHNRLKTSLNDALQGPNRAHAVIVTEEGIKIEKAGIPPDDAQFLETRKFQTLEVARWFNVPPHKLRDLERATFSNIEQQSIEFVSDSLMPWLVKWEKEIWRKLIRPMEQRQQFVKFTVDGLLRGQTVERYQAYAVGRQWGWLSPNDILELEDKNGLGPQGDIYLVPQNMMPADRINDVIDAQIEPTPAAAPAPPPMQEPDRMRLLADLLAERLRGELPTAADQAALIQHAADASIQALPPPPAPPEPVREVVEEAAARLLGRLDEIDRAHTTQAANGEQAAEAERQARAAQETALADSLAATQAAAAASRAELAETRAAVDAVHAALATAQAELAARLDEIGRAQSDGATKDEQAKEAERQARAAAEAALAESLAATQAAAVAARAELVDTRAVVGLLTVGQAELSAHLEAEQAERRALAGRIADLVPSLRDVIEGALRKEVRFEADRARKAAQSPEKLRAWIESFYATREEALVQMLLPALRLHFVLTGRADAAEAHARTLLAPHVAESRASLLVLLEAPEDLEANVKALVSGWETRPGTITDGLVREIIAKGEATNV